MLVVKDGHGAAAEAKNGDHLFKNLIARPQGLALFVVGIVAVLGDEQHAVYGQLAAAQG